MDQPKTNKEILKKVLKSGGTGAAFGTGLGFLARSSKPMLRNVGKAGNPMNKGPMGGANKRALDGVMEGIDNKYLPAVTGLGVGSYMAGNTLVKELIKRRKQKKAQE